MSERLKGVNTWSQGRKLSKSHKQKLSKASEGKAKSAEHCAHISSGRKGIQFSEEHRQNRGLAQKRLWQDPKFVAKQIAARRTLPNLLEKRALRGLGPNWQYTGAGSLVIGGKCPDFWDGDKGLIEVFGCFWHGCLSCYPESLRYVDPMERVRHFQQFGYATQVIWEHEVSRES